MRRKINKGPYITRKFRFFWHKCEICQDEFRYEKDYEWTYFYQNARFVMGLGYLPNKDYHFCNKHTRDDIKAWIKNFLESKAIPTKPSGYNPPPKNAKMPEKPTPAPPKCE